MSDRNKKFHEFAFKSVLFKGHTDWYFCYIKSERIAQVLVLLLQKSNAEDTNGLVIRAAKIPESITYFAAGDVDLSMVLADIFSIITALRVYGTSGIIENTNVQLLISEYQNIAERMGSGTHPSPFVSVEDLSVPFDLGELKQESLAEQLKLAEPATPIKDISKGHYKRQSVLNQNTSKFHDGRTEKIFNFVLHSNGVSIKEIATVVQNCSEKTIQRELMALIDQGLIKKVGERRWSLYVPAKKQG